ncbi:zinc ribbon domain-containing protein [Chlorogloeopsis fritschii]|uniref:zinc ribbon domain-containing protein n=1 Tax=Chlorogloeopsis fritschii TaxID=1124 RepID=UPI003C6C4D4B
MPGGKTHAERSVAWGNFLTMLEYKGDIYGCEIRYVNRFFPSSKRGSGQETTGLATLHLWYFT